MDFNICSSLSKVKYFDIETRFLQFMLSSDASENIKSEKHEISQMYRKSKDR